MKFLLFFYLLSLTSPALFHLALARGASNISISPGFCFVLLQCFVFFVYSYDNLMFFCFSVVKLVWFGSWWFWTKKICSPASLFSLFLNLFYFYVPTWHFDSFSVRIEARKTNIWFRNVFFFILDFLLFFIWSVF